MKLLLDSCTLIWLETCRVKIPDRVLAAVEDGSNRVFVSSASSWELAIKKSLGRLTPGFEPEKVLPQVMTASGIEGLVVSHEHALGVAALPRHHRDPFDRLLVSQCLVEGLTIVTPDQAFHAYGIPVLW